MSGYGAEPDSNRVHTRPTVERHECARCGKIFRVRGLRQRVQFEDFAESSATYDWLRLCNPCWWFIYDAACGKGKGTKGGTTE